MIERLRHALHRGRHPLRYAHLDRLLNNQALDRAQLLAKQRQDLADIVAFAAAHAPYYTETLAPLVERGHFDIAELPILNKDDAVRRLDDLLAGTADRSRAKLGHTGGSTGKPLAFWYDDAKHEPARLGRCAGRADAAMIERLRHALHRGRHPLRYAHLDRLLNNQALDRAQLLAKQRQDLADIVAFAAAHAPYYTETLAPLVERGHFDIAELPILNKD
ncbi:MAG: hypothetical protein M1449_04480, partial [Candidatus Thermoplasmatota archaeon]|nr:hypothetical protein [Candidatus Thermoplasmatota archaeon]